jgi:hypothetical protein
MKKRNKIIYWIATIWLTIGMISTGIFQLFNMEEQIASILALGYPVYFVTLLGFCKIIGTIAVLIPRYTLLKEWAYAGFVFMMLGACYSHLAAGSAIVEALPSVLLLTLTVVSWYFRPAERKATTTDNSFSPATA